VFSSDAGGTIASGSFGGASSISLVNPSGTNEMLISIATPWTVTQLAAGTQISLTNIWDNESPPHDYSVDPAWLSLGRTLPAPYNAYGQNGPGANWSLDWPNPIASDSFPTPNNNDTPAATHRATDVLVSVPPSSTTDSRYFIWPIWARDSVKTEVQEADYESLTPERSASVTIGLVRDFTGTQWLRDQDMTVQARVNPSLTPGQVNLHFDTNVAGAYKATSANGPVGLWLPAFNEDAAAGSSFAGIVPKPNTDTSMNTVSAPASGLLWNNSIPAADSKVKSGATLDFFYSFGAVNTVDPLYAGRLDIRPGADVPSNWFRLVKPFSFNIQDVKLQRSSVTILNNVIDPTKGEFVRVSYQLAKSGPVTVQVFTLDGDLVQVLYRGSRAAGDYTASWDGKNRGGRAVARGMYFIRVVGPELDEIRKVMVVKQ
jgi:hypothetical protein